MARMLAKNAGMDDGQQYGQGKYGSEKAWADEGATGAEFVSADESMAYVKPKKYAMFDPKPEVQQADEETDSQSANQKMAEAEAQHSEEEEAQAEEVVAKKYKRTDWKKRHDDLKRHYDRKLKEFEAEKKQYLSQLENQYKPPKDKDELESFRKENPDLYEVVESVSHLRTVEELETMKKELAEMKEAVMLEKAKAAYAELKARVPDFEQIRSSQDFHAWAEVQPEEIQNWVYKNSTNVELAVRAINLYKADRGVASSEPKKEEVQAKPRADMAVSVKKRMEEPASRDKVWKASEIARLAQTNWREYERLMPEIDKAFQEGRVDPNA